MPAGSSGRRDDAVVVGGAVLEVRTFADDGPVVVEVAGEVDLLTAGRLRAALDEAVRVAGGGRVIVDLGRVDFLDSTGVQALIDGYHTAMVAGGTLTVRGAHGPPARVLTVTGLARLLGVEPRR
ncbi:STAS domain-containing protein [Planosporangium thailandense]|uniref:Anti-sigma factor antagonist n=1 Tax=Planosporangium thailandense TaxID=765197 RepID=A0ABX0Y6P4_9ACTN|nr:STAS domain-containing protein [Planosporangium thailandense]NJC74008.1 STAS domain-containing protein [Planosporangium thailandense]